MSSEAQLATSRGGTGVNSTATFPSTGTVATVPAAGVVKSNGTALSSGNVDLASEVTGVLPTANGGTGVNSTAVFPSSGNVTTDTNTQTLTNKTIDGDDNTIQDVSISSLKTVLADANKFVTRDGSGAVVSTVSLPSGTVVGTTDTQTLSNKTLDNTTSLTILDNNLTIQDDGDNTKQFKFEANTISSGNIRTLQVPDENIIITGTAATQTLTNKDIDGGTASNSRRITLPKHTKSALDALTRKEATVVYGTDSKKVYVDDGSNLIPVGTSGVKNYFPTGDAEQGLSISAYADGGAQPTDGQGGSPVLSVALTSVSPLAGSNSFYIGTGNTGDGFSILSDTIDRKDWGKVFVLELDLQYVASLGTPAANDFGVYVLDVNNSNAKVLLQPSNEIPTIGANVQALKYYVQIPYGATQLRLCVHQQQAIGTTYYFKAEFSLTEQVSAGYAPISTDPVSFNTSVGTWLKAVTSDPTSYGTIVRNIGMMSRQGGKMNYTWQFEQSSAGSGGSGTYLLKLPYKIDLTKYGLSQSYVDTSFNLEVLAEGEFFAYYNNGGDSGVAAHLYIYDESTLYAAIKSNSGTYNYWSSSFFELTASGTMSYNIWVNIWTLGQSAETKVISEYDGRVVAFRGYDTTGQSLTANVTKIQFTADIDNQSCWDGDEFRPKTAGYYLVSTKVSTNSGSFIYAFVNGTQRAYLQNAYNSQELSGTAIVFLNVGDVLDIRCGQSVTLTSSEHTLDIFMLSGSQQILAGQNIQAEAYLTADTTFSGAVVTFDAKTVDTTNSFDTSNGRFTAPVSGSYHICVTAANASGSGNLYTRINGANDSRAKLLLQHNVYSAVSSGSTIINMTKGEYLEIFCTGGRLSAGTNPTQTNISIKQVN